jgi:hypothetical protein
MENINAILFIIVFLGGAFFTIRWAWKQPPTDYWQTYQEQLEKDSRWYRCQDWNGGPGCDWPENCHPGDCRRPDAG